MPSFSESLEKTLHNALKAASERHHEYATLEHLLFALIDDDHAAEVMRACGVAVDDLQSAVVHYLDTELDSLKVEGHSDPSPTSGFQRVVQRAILHVQSSGKDEVTGANVLVALFSERESYAVYFLQQQDLTRLDAVSYLSHGVGKGGKPSPQAEPEEKEEAKEKSDGKSKKETALDQFTVNLNEKAKIGKVDPLIGRHAEVDRTIQILCRRSKNNPLYVGDPGVGKTAIAEGLARKIVEGDVPRVLLPASSFARHGRAARGARAIAVISRNGLKQVVTELEGLPHAILFIDEIHTVSGAGATSGGRWTRRTCSAALSAASSAASARRPTRSSATISKRTARLPPVPEDRCGRTDTRGTPRRFSPAAQRVRGASQQVRYTQDAINAAVDLSARYINDRKLPTRRSM